MLCKRCHLPPSTPVREAGDLRWPSAIEGYCLTCVIEIVKEWKSGNGEAEALRAHLKDAMEMRDKFYAIASKPVGILTTPGPLEPGEAERIKAKFEAAFSGPYRTRLEVVEGQPKGWRKRISAWWRKVI